MSNFATNIITHPLTAIIVAVVISILVRDLPKSSRPVPPPIVPVNYINPDPETILRNALTAPGADIYLGSRALGEFLTQHGRWSEAIDALSLAAVGPSPQHALSASVSIAHCEVQRGQLDAAGKVLASLDKNTDPGIVASALAVQADLHRVRGNFAAAESALRNSAGSAKATASCTLAAEAGAANAEQLCLRALKQEAGVRTHAPLLALGRLARAAGSSRLAKQHFSRARAALAAVPQHPALAEAALELAVEAGDVAAVEALAASLASRPDAAVQHALAAVARVALAGPASAHEMHAAVRRAHGPSSLLAARAHLAHAAAGEARAEQAKAALELLSHMDGVGALTKEAEALLQ